MPTFVWTAKDRSGKTILREVFADTTEQSRAILLTENLTELELVGDEVMDAVQGGFTDTPKLFGEEIRPTAEQKLEARRNPRNTFWSALGQGINQSKWFCAFIVLLMFSELWRGHQVSAILAGIGLIAWLTFLICVALPSIYYAKLIKASDWYRWDEVTELAAKCEQLGKFHFIKIPAVELIRLRAKALAGQGRLAEAIALYQPCKDQPGCPGWLHTAFVASLYTTAKQYDLAVDYTRRSLAENPRSANYLDLANRLARYKKDPVGARCAMAEAEKTTLNKVSIPFHLRLRGIIAWLEGNNAAAKIDLEAAIALVEKDRNRPYRDGHLAVAKAYLACVLAGLGDLPAAKKSFAEAEEYLVATEETELIAECQSAIGKS